MHTINYTRVSFLVTTLEPPGTSQIVSDQIFRIFVVLNLVVINGTLGVIGIVFNIINIIVFVKQGFQETVNISLCGLAIADFFSLIFLIWLSICLNPMFPFDKNWDPIEVQYLTASWPHVCFTRVTGWITAYITFERCLCIVIPLKVKSILTHRLSFMAVVGIFVSMLSILVFIFSSTYLVPEYNAKFNRTVLGMSYNGETGKFLEDIALTINVVSQVGSFFTVIICTAVIVSNLNVQTQWRKTTRNAMTEEDQHAMSARDKRVVNMVVFIAAIFILCFLPSVAGLIMMIFLEDFTITGQQINFFLVMWGIFLNLEAVNSTVNIFVYYKMSSRYRETFRELFGLEGRKESYDDPPSN